MIRLISNLILLAGIVMAVNAQMSFLDSLRGTAPKVEPPFEMPRGFLERLKLEKSIVETELSPAVTQEPAGEVFDEIASLTETIEAPQEEQEQPAEEPEFEEIKEGIEAAPLEDLELAPSAEGDLAEAEVGSSEEIEFAEIPVDFSRQEANLIRFHRHHLEQGTFLQDEEGTTTVYITGVQGPDGREYLVPGFFNGRRQPAEAAMIRAMMVGLDNYPSYESPEAAEEAVQRLREVITADEAIFSGTTEESSEGAQPLSEEEEEAAGPTIEEILAMEPIEEADVGSNEPMDKRPKEEVEGPRETRGIRNHNPGNIRHSRSQWQGMAQKQGDDDFVSFESPEMGIRALTRVLSTYQKRHGLNTIEAIVGRWAPPNENDTRAYINSVAQKTGIPAGFPLDLQSVEILVPLIKAIIFHENGSQPYDDQTILRGIQLSGILKGS